MHSTYDPVTITWLLRSVTTKISVQLCVCVCLRAGGGREGRREGRTNWKRKRIELVQMLIIELLKIDIIGMTNDIINRNTIMAGKFGEVLKLVI